jgi:UMF1 family MFS transporter
MKITKEILSWSLYDLANSVFTVTVISGFFPLFLKHYWASNLPATESTYYLGIANFIAGLILLFISPYLGAFSDKQANKKQSLVFFAGFGMLFCASLAFVPLGAWQWAILLYILAVVGFQGANIFYDSLLLTVANKSQVDYVSSLGYALGYIGGGVFFLGAVFLYLKPEWFGLQSGVQGIQLSFVAVAIWWALFSLPLIFFVRESKKTAAHFLESLMGAFLQLKTTLQNIQKYRTVFSFLIAYWFYIDGATTLIKMAVDFGITLGFPASSLIIALLLVQFIAFPCSLLYYKFGKKIGIKRALLLSIFAYGVITMLGYFMQSVLHFYLLAFCIGIFQGGLFALSRSYYSQLIPQKQAGEFFGFYTLWTRFASLLGPLMVGVIAKYTANPRTAILSIVLLFAIGGFLLMKNKKI